MLTCKYQFVAFVALALLMVGSIECAAIEDNETSDMSDNYGGVHIYQSERNCAMVGGMCVQKEDCAEATTKQGLCSKNQHKGVECCYSVVARPAPCQQLGGACMAWCNQRLVRPEATDCPSTTKCCVLV